MTNEYEVAAVIELGSAEDVVLGAKMVAQQLDSQTGEPGTFFNPATDE